MDDLISRQAAIDALDVLCQEHRYRIPGERETYSEYNEAWQDALDRAEGLIFNLPTIQPEPQEGHWIWVAGELMCSECRTIYSDLYPDYDNAVACPHCGAKMKGEQNE